MKISSYDESTIYGNELSAKPIAQGFIKENRNGNTSSLELKASNKQIFLEFFDIDVEHIAVFEGVEGYIILEDRKSKEPALKFNTGNNKANKEIWSKFQEVYIQNYYRSNLSYSEYVDSISIVFKKEYDRIHINILPMYEYSVADKVADATNYYVPYEYEDLSPFRIYSFDNIFSCFKYQLILPSYQRGYDWGEQEINDFIDDLIYTTIQNIGHSKAKYRHFMGNILIQDKKLLDGQQRLTTFLLLALVLNNIKGENNQVKKMADNCFYNNEYKIKYNHTMLEVLNSIRDNKKCLLESNLLNNRNQLQSKLFNSLNENNLTFEQFYVHGLRNVDIMVEEITPEHDENMVFETVNNRGKPLSSYDLIKSFILKNDRIGEMVEAYSEVVELLTRTSITTNIDQEQMTTLFRDYLAITTGELYAKTKNDTKGANIYKGYKKYIEAKYLSTEVTKDIFDAELRNMITIFPLLRKLYKTEDFSMRWILSFHAEIVPFVATIFLKTNNSEKDEIVDTLVAYVMRLRLRNVKQKSWVYSKAAHRIYITDEISFIDLRMHLKSNELGPLKLVENSQIATNTVYTRTEVVMEIFSMYQYKKFNFVNKNMVLEKEHIAPTSTDVYTSELSNEDNLNRIGNYLPLEKNLNIKATNNQLKYKLPIYKTSNSPIVKEFANAFCSHNTWVDGDIEQRSKILVSEILNYFPL